LHIIETIVSIPTKFCTVIKTIKCPSWVVRTHASQIQDGGRPPSWKNPKIAMYLPRFDRFRPNLARQCSSTLLSRPTVKFEILKIQYGGGRRLKKIEKSPYLRRVLTDFDQIWHDDAFRPL